MESGAIDSINKKRVAQVKHSMVQSQKPVNLVIDYYYSYMSYLDYNQKATVITFRSLHYSKPFSAIAYRRTL